MRAFVAGATGYTGREVVRELARRNGGAVVAHVRPDSPRLEEWRRRFEAMGATIDTTAWEQEALETAFSRHDPTHIFALLGTTRARAREAARAGSEEGYESVDYRLTAILLHAARTCAPAARFIYLSSLGVSAGARGAYLAVRWRLESELKASGLRYVIARPAFVTGSDREDFRLGERLVARASDAALNAFAAVGLKRLRNRFASLSGRALARALAVAACDPACTDVTLEADQLRALAYD